MKTPNIYEIAKKANVSIATISRAINPETREKVSPETLQKIDDLIKRFGYTPSRAAKNLSNRKYKNIGVLFPHHREIFRESYYSEILSGISDALIDTAYHLRLVLLKCTDSKWDHYNFGLAEEVSGLIVTHWHAFFSSKSALEKIGIPCVVINDPEKNIRAHFVSGDHEMGGKLAAEHLFSQGHRQFAILTGPADSSDSKLRVQGFQKYLKEKGVSVDPKNIVSGDFQSEKAEEAVETIFKKKNKITALFCCNDQMAFGALRKLSSLEISCPGDISVVGYDDERQGALSNPPLTTIQVPLSAMSAGACGKLVSFLEKKISKEAFYGQALMPVRLIRRASTAVKK